MNVFGSGLEESEIDEIRRQFPNFTGVVPPEAEYWSKADLEQFFKSDGAIVPHTSAGEVGQSCTLLTRLRVGLAEENIQKATAEYLSYCKHRKQRSHFCNLPDIKLCNPVSRVREAPARLQAPVTIVPRRDKDPPALSWNLQYWLDTCPDDVWTSRARWPVFEKDKKGLDSASFDLCIWEYIEYMRVVESMDSDCSEDNAIAYPRVHVEGWCPFANVRPARKQFEAHWRELTPPGVKDATARWVEIAAGVMEEGDWMETLARYYQLSVGATGSVTRLHVENHGAHVWFTQIEGQKLFFLFPPQDGAKLYEETGDYVDAPGGYATQVSPVDPFFPNQKRHPKFSEVSAQVALLGEGKTLIVPAGWWWCAVATEQSITLRHPYWGMENRMRFVDDLWAPYEGKSVAPDVRESVRERFTELRELIAGDDGDDLEKYVVVDGG